MPVSPHQPPPPSKSIRSNNFITQSLCSLLLRKWISLNHIISHNWIIANFLRHLRFNIKLMLFTLVWTKSSWTNLVTKVSKISKHLSSKMVLPVMQVMATKWWWESVLLLIVLLQEVFKMGRVVRRWMTNMNRRCSVRKVADRSTNSRTIPKMAVSIVIVIDSRNQIRRTTGAFRPNQTQIRPFKAFRNRCQIIKINVNALLPTRQKANLRVKSRIRINVKATGMTKLLWKMSNLPLKMQDSDRNAMSSNWRRGRMSAGDLATPHTAQIMTIKPVIRSIFPLFH